MKVRPLEEKDIPQVAEVGKICWQDTYQTLYPQKVILSFVSHAYSLKNLKKSWIADCQRKKRQFYVGVEEGKVIGFAEMMKKGAKQYELTRIYVLPAFQGQGVGKSLLSHLLTLVEAPCDVVAWVEKENKPGRLFYESLRFIVEKEEVDTSLGATTILMQYVKKHI